MPITATIKKGREIGFVIPDGYLLVHELKLLNLRLWFLLEDDAIFALYSSLNSRYSDRHVLPFARTLASDDIACFLISETGHRQGGVVVIHDYALPGTEVEKRFETFWDWFRFAVEQMIQWSESSE